MKLVMMMMMMMMMMKEERSRIDEMSVILGHSSTQSWASDLVALPSTSLDGFSLPTSIGS